MDDKKKSLHEKIGEYLIDLSKLTFGGAVLTIALQMGTNKMASLFVGLIATIGIALVGFYLYNRKK